MKPPRFLLWLARRLGVWWARHEVAADPGAGSLTVPSGDGYDLYMIDWHGKRIDRYGKTIAWLILDHQAMPDAECAPWIGARLCAMIQGVCDLGGKDLTIRGSAPTITGPWHLAAVDEATRSEVSLGAVAAQSPAHAAELRAMLGKVLVDLAQKRNGG